MKILALIFHKILSQQHESEVTVIPRDEVLALPDTRADTLLASIIDSYSRESFLAYAGFAEQAWFPQELKRVLKEELTFYDFSIAGLSNLQKRMEKVPATTGGYLTYIYYARGGSKYLMVILLKDRQGIAITPELDLANVESLELERLHFAATIDIDSWLSASPQKPQNYVSFLKGRARTETVVNYFKAFLGIDESLYLDPARHTLDLVNSLKNFTALALPDHDRDAAIDRVFDYATDAQEKDEPISIQAVSILMTPGDPDKFTTYLQQEEIKIPGQFKTTKSNLQALMMYRVRTDDYYLSFKRSAVAAGRIWINNQGYLVLQDVPDDLRTQLPGG